MRALDIAMSEQKRQALLNGNANCFCFTTFGRMSNIDVKLRQTIERNTLLVIGLAEQIKPIIIIQFLVFV